MIPIFYRILFWTGYLAVLITAFIPVAGSLSKIKLGPESFQIRLDYLLHLTVYFFICMYYLGGIKMDLSLFDHDPLKKFILLVIFLALITELVQLLVPERAFNVFDVISNVAGVGLGVLIIKMAQRSKGTDYLRQGFGGQRAQRH